MTIYSIREVLEVGARIVLREPVAGTPTARLINMTRNGQRCLAVKISGEWRPIASSDASKQRKLGRPVATVMCE